MRFAYELLPGILPDGDERDRQAASDKAIVFRIVFKPGFAKRFHKFVFVYLKIFAQLVERRVKVTQFHVDCAKQHDRVFGQVHTRIEYRINMFAIHWKQRRLESSLLAENFIRLFPRFPMQR